jgi:2-hydroxymethylglutarate dehydrogenase
MGLPMAQNLVKAGLKVNGYNPSEEKRRKLESSGGIACRSAAEAVRDADIVMMSLPTPAVVEDVMLSPGGVLANCRKGIHIIDFSSVGSSTSRKIYVSAAERGVCYADAPVSGGVKGARAGTLTVMFGGDRSTYDSVLEVLKIVGSRVIYVGTVGSGDAIKIVNNLMLGCNMAAAAEAIKLGNQLGLSTQTIREIVLDSSGNSYAFSAKIDSFILAGSYEGGFATELQLKDLRLALDMAEEVGLSLPMGERAAERYADNCGRGNGKLDISALMMK